MVNIRLPSSEVFMRSVLCLTICTVSFPLALVGQVGRDSFITSYAGATWTFPGNGGPAVNAPISQVISLNTDNQGNIIFADPGNHVVSRINSDGTITVIAGNGLRGFSGDGGPALSASLNNPIDAVMDTNGDLYITDSFNNRIREVTPDGIISTLYYNVDSGARLAIDTNSATRQRRRRLFRSGSRVNNPLYNTAPGSCLIYVTTPGGGLSTFAGNGICGHSGDGGPATEAMISPGVGGLAVDEDGNVYLAEAAADYIRKITPDGIITTIAGTGEPGHFSGDGGPALAASFNVPQSLVLDNLGNLLVSDQNNGAIRQISPKGIISTIAGTGVFSIPFSGDGGPATQAQFLICKGLAIDGNGNIYVADSGHFRIRRIQGGIVNTIAGNAQFRVVPDGTPATQAYLFGPDDLAFDMAGNLLVSTVAGSKVGRIAPDGTYSILAGTGASGAGGFNGPAISALIGYPRGLVADPLGDIFFSDNGASVVYDIDAATKDLLVLAGKTFAYGYSGDGGPSTKATLRTPYGIARDASGNLFIADPASNVIRRVASTGLFITTFAGTGTNGFSGDNGLASEATLSYPQNLAFDGAGDLLICDRDNNRIRMITPAGIITTIAGDGQALTAGDGGPALQASLNGPFNIALDSFGNIYILEASGAVLRRIDISGNISTLAGFPGLRLNTLDGASAGLAGLDVDGLAFDKADNLYLASYNSDKIRVILTSPPTFSTSTTSLTFSGLSGGAPAQMQSVAVNSALAGAVVSVSSDSGWLTVQNGSSYALANAPLNVGVQADPSQLTPGTYHGNLSLSRLTADASNPFAAVAVTFNVAASVPAKLAVQPGALIASVTSGGAPQAQSFQVINGGTGSLNFTVSVSGAAAAAINLSVQNGTVQAGSPLTVVATIDPASLSAGTANANLVVSSTTTGETINIPVTISVTPSPNRLALSQSGLLFTAVQSGGVTPPQSFTVLNTGSSVFNWSATAITFPAGSTWLKVTPNAGSSSAGSPAGGVTVTADPTQLGSAGTYYGVVRNASPGTANAPQDIEVVLNLLSPDNTPGALLTPAGMVFTTVAGANASSQTFVITNLDSSPLPFRITTATLDGNPWLQAAPTTTPNPIPPGGSQLITVQSYAVQPVNMQPGATQPNPVAAPLTAGVYYGTVLVQFQGFDLNLYVLLVVSSTGSGASSSGRDVAAGCQPTQLLPVFSSFLQNFSVPASWPIALNAMVVDDCGNPQTSGRVAVSFSNGDPRLSLVSTGNGNWGGTWFGGNTANSQVVVTLTADTDNPKLHGSNPYTGTLQPNNNIPSLTNGGITSAGLAPPQAPLSPGAIISINGASLAFGPTSNSQFPLGNTLGGNQVLMAGELLPLIYSSGGAISAVVPYDVSPNAQYSVIVGRGNTISNPQTVAVAAAQPAVFLVDAVGDPATPGQLWTQLTSGTPTDPSKAAPVNPVGVGDPLIIYCTGLGAVNGTANASLPAPSTPLALQNPVSVTIGGLAANVSLAGVVPGFTGLYQVKVAVPSGVSPGAAVPLIVTSSGESSSVVNLSVH
jgi:uncharacterized protein (TIGR03437 family)